MGSRLAWRELLPGLPLPSENGRPVEDPQSGLAGYPAIPSGNIVVVVRIMNDCGTAAWGVTTAGGMLFLGLGTAVGSAYLADHLVLSLDLGLMKYGEETLYKLLGDEVSTNW